MPRLTDKREGLDPRVEEMLENDPGEWRVDYVSGFWRRQQTDPALPGYETSDEYNSHPPDRITWPWLEDINLIDKKGWPRKQKLKSSTGSKFLKSALKQLRRGLAKSDG